MKILAHNKMIGIDQTKIGYILVIFVAAMNTMYKVYIFMKQYPLRAFCVGATRGGGSTKICPLGFSNIKLEKIPDTFFQILWGGVAFHFAAHPKNIKLRPQSSLIGFSAYVSIRHYQYHNAHIGQCALTSTLCPNFVILGSRTLQMLQACYDNNKIIIRKLKKFQNLQSTHDCCKTIFQRQKFIF